MPHIAVVGAGMGGLSAAADLARRGYRVSVFEKETSPGGKLRQVEVGAATIDAGPTVFTMHWVFEGLFRDAGARLEDHLTLDRAEVLARHAWPDGGRLDLFADRLRSQYAIKEFAGQREAAGFRDFCRRSASVHAALRDSFMTRALPSQAELIATLARRGLAADGLRAMLGTPPWQSLWRALAEHFHDPRLRQLFGRFSTYVGSSPLAAPATLMLIAHVEQEGVWLVRGGMRKVAEALQQLGESGGARYHFDTAVSELVLCNGQCCGLKLATGEIIEADAIVFNGDANALAAGFLGRDAVSAGMPMARAARALSAVTWCVKAPTRGFELEHHNVFFGDRYPEEFQNIFERRHIKPQPTVYLCAQDRGAATTGAASGNADSGERMLLLVNAPADGDTGGIDDERLATLEQEVGELLSHCGLQIERRAGDCIVTRPQDFERLFPGTGGSLYGRANHGAFASFARPGAATAIPGLYLAGGSVHPGPGIPMATLSGRIVAEKIAEDFA
ncbi:MAG: phytoene desaturase [Gammaproteobacteria bacterium]|nr:phytoene desaturase [Gammaproteobacteria bacterium]